MNREPRFLERLENASDRGALRVLYASLKKSGDKKRLHRLRKFVSLAYAYGGTSYFIKYDDFIRNLTKPGSKTLDCDATILFGKNVKEIFVC